MLIAFSRLCRKEEKNKRKAKALKELVQWRGGMSTHLCELLNGLLWVKSALYKEIGQCVLFVQLDSIVAQFAIDHLVLIRDTEIEKVKI